LTIAIPPVVFQASGLADANLPFPHSRTLSLREFRGTKPLHRLSSPLSLVVCVIRLVCARFPPPLLERSLEDRTPQRPVESTRSSLPLLPVSMPSFYGYALFHSSVPVEASAPHSHLCAFLQSQSFLPYQTLPTVFPLISWDI